MLVGKSLITLDKSIEHSISSKNFNRDTRWKYVNCDTEHKMLGEESKDLDWVYIWN